MGTIFTSVISQKLCTFCHQAGAQSIWACWIKHSWICVRCHYSSLLFPENSNTISTSKRTCNLDHTSCLFFSSGTCSERTSVAVLMQPWQNLPTFHTACAVPPSFKNIYNTYVLITSFSTKMKLMVNRCSPACGNWNIFRQPGKCWITLRWCPCNFDGRELEMKCFSSIQQCIEIQAIIVDFLLYYFF